MSSHIHAEAVSKRSSISSSQFLKRHAPTKVHATLPPLVQEVLRSPGRPLDKTTREYMEPRFGHDFTNVRIHTDARASESAQAVNARAYTVGNKVVLGSGQYAPTTTSGRELLGHELAHTIQQESSRSAPPSSDPNGVFESTASAAGRSVANGQYIGGNLPACGVGLSRTPLNTGEDPERAAAVAEADALLARMEQEDKKEKAEEEAAKATAQKRPAVPGLPRTLSLLGDDPALEARKSPDEIILDQLDQEKKAEATAKRLAQRKEEEGRPIRLTALRERLRHGHAKSTLAKMLATLPPRDMQILKRYGLKWPKWYTKPGTFQDSVTEAIDSYVQSGEANAPDADEYSALLEDERAYYQRNFANYQSYQQKTEAIVNAGPASLAGRAIGTAIGGERGGDWGALIGGGVDLALPVYAGIKGGSGQGTEDFSGSGKTPSAIRGEPPEPVNPMELQPEMPPASTNAPRSFGRGGPLDKTQPPMAFEKTEPGSPPPRRDTQASIPPSGGGGGGGGGRRGRSPGQTIPGNPPPMPKRPPPPRPVIDWFPRRDATPMGPEDVLRVLQIDHTRIIWSMNRGNNMTEWSEVAKGRGLPPLAYTVGNKVRVDYYRWRAMGLPEPQVVTPRR